MKPQHLCKSANANSTKIRCSVPLLFPLFYSHHTTFSLSHLLTLSHSHLLHRFPFFFYVSLQIISTLPVWVGSGPYRGRLLYFQSARINASLPETNSDWRVHSTWTQFFRLKSKSHGTLKRFVHFYPPLINMPCYTLFLSVFPQSPSGSYKTLRSCLACSIIAFRCLSHEIRLNYPQLWTVTKHLFHEDELRMKKKKNLAVNRRYYIFSKALAPLWAIHRQ